MTRLALLLIGTAFALAAIYLLGLAMWESNFGSQSRNSIAGFIFCVIAATILFGAWYRRGRDDWPR
ncbi:MAG: hypothetical protein H0U53_08795 [Actinobacteria bacterium]|nr:hypothetical protein [Actinomycetota bacterium]